MKFVRLLPLLFLVGCATGTGGAPQACLDALSAADNIDQANTAVLVAFGGVVEAIPDAVASPAHIPVLTERLNDVTAISQEATKVIQGSNYKELSEMCRTS